MAARRKRLLIRADGGATIGAGHVMRCVALAQAWRKSGGDVCFAHAEIAPPLAARLQREGFSSIQFDVQRGTALDAERTCQLADREAIDWVVADGYCFDVTWQRAIRASGRRLMVIDDYAHLERYDADVVLNQNIGISRELYRGRTQDARLLLGSRFAMLRQEFTDRQPPRVKRSQGASRVLVTLGGGDPDNVTAIIIRALVADPRFEAVVAVGGSNRNLVGLQELVRENPRIRIQVDADMPALMAHAEVAVSAAGSTVWELAYFGVPSLVIAIAENQKSNAAELDRRGIAKSLGFHDAVSVAAVANALDRLSSDYAARERMSEAARALIDGGGADRVAMQLSSFDLRLRRADARDMRLLWEWVNEPSVRQSAFNSAPISWEQHVAWFERKRVDPACTIFVGLNAEGTPVGQVRFDRVRPREVDVDVSVDAATRRGGLGSALIARAVDELVATTDTLAVNAYIKPDNRASMRAFARAGFRIAGKKQVQDHEALHMTFGRDE